MDVQEKSIYLTADEWKSALSSPISKTTMRHICLTVVNQGGAVMALMPDGSSIAKRMDTSTQVNEAFESLQ